MKVKKNHITLLTGILLVICMIAGCRPMNKESAVDADWEEVLAELKETAPNEVEDHISIEVSKNFIFDADISVSDELDTYSLEEVTMYRRIFEEEEKEIFLQRLMDETGWCGEEALTQAVLYGEEVGVPTYENGQIDETLILEFEDKTAWIGDLDIHVGNDTFIEKYGIFTDNLFPSRTSNPATDYIEIIKEPAELDFMSLQEAETYIKQFSESFGIEFQCETISYVCTLERLEKIANLLEDYKQQYRPDYESPDFTKEEEAYIIVLQQGYKGVPILPYNLSKTETNTTWTSTQCYAFYSANGIEELSLQYVFDIKKGMNPKEILSLGDILERYCDQYADSIGIKETVVKVQLHYLPVLTDEETGEFTAKPVWYVLSNIERDTPEGKTMTRRATVYDAVTGEVLKWEE